MENKSSPREILIFLKQHMMGYLAENKKGGVKTIWYENQLIPAAICVSSS
jgi:hypothetical protein